ncbi:uncharacterized protein LOC109838800 [Asparagus officinalis]|uniref:uncharacterized protein LOC109838800 n=1 Tax=Asparagus officinalis TaxID=4686 RepID=UPI00098DF8B4|nr:uncharacterized protein LOC109838800 [Asparagus officinalis]
MRKKKKSSGKSVLSSELRESMFVFPSSSIPDGESNGTVEAEDSEGSSSRMIMERPPEKTTDEQVTEIPKTFASLFADNRKSGKGLNLSYVPHSQMNTAIFSMEEWMEGEGYWRFALVGHVIGLNVRFKSMESYVNKLWGSISIPEIHLIKPGVFLFDFQSEKQMYDVLEAGPWFFGSRPLVLKPWSIETDMDRIQDSSYPLWVQFPNLRLNLWSSTGISKVASLIGKPITTDKLTATRKRISYARVLLEVQLPLTSPLPDQIVIQGPNGKCHNQKVIYEFKPRWCDTCKAIGHSTEQCRKKNGKMKWMPVNRNANSNADANAGVATVTTIAPNIGDIPGVSSIEVNSDTNSKEHAEPIIAPHIHQDPIIKEGSGIPGGYGARAQGIASALSSPVVNVTGFSSVVKGKSIRKSGGVTNDKGTSKSVEAIPFFQYKLPFIALLETKIAGNKLHAIAKKVAKDWSWISNCHQANNARIWILWDSDLFSLQLLNSSNQFMTCAVKSKDCKLSCTITIVYALNDNSGRKALWHDILAFKNNVTGPWIIGGDFNTIINNSEKIGGVPVSVSDTEDFLDFISSSQLVHLKTAGLDRVLANEDWIRNYTSSQVEFLTPNCSDHSPELITIGNEDYIGKRPFKFFKMWATHPDFLSAVASSWDKIVMGYNMYKFHTKLKNLKPVLKELNKRNFMNISEQVLRAKNDLDEVQKQLSIDPFNAMLISKEKDSLNKYVKLLDHEASFYRQKANIKWGKYGDKCTQFFHSVMKANRHHNRVLSLYLDNGQRITDMTAITAKFIEYYEQLLGTSVTVIPPDPEVIANGPLLSATQRNELSLPITREEIKAAVFSMADDRAPGPDGFSASFYKTAWSIINEDLYLAI